MNTETLGPVPLIAPTARVSDSRLGIYTEIGANAVLNEVTLGDYSYLMDGAMAWCVEIGKFCSIAAYTRLNAPNHPTWRATQHHFTYRSAAYGLADTDDTDFFAWRRDHRVTIGHDVWIGHGAIVLPGVAVGTGAVIGAGTVVTRDVAPYTIVAGNPARPIRRRVTEAVEARLLALAWWDWPHDRLRDALQDFRTLDADGFCAKHAAGG
ncbi:DapH/DapD/GlmU-related protein [Inquilinus sp. YAF38]|uniref:DapH/DapD/GlmU-related protein n=1 Tax=Inquilinus sp. YAF38 TaxID=3233084 RepID=UPI003F93E8D7